MTNVGSSRVFNTLLLIALTGVAVQMYRSFLLVPQFQLFALRVITMFLEALPFLVAAALLTAIAREILPSPRIVQFCRERRPLGLPLIVISGFLLPLDEVRLPALFRDLRSRGLPTPHLAAALLAIPLINPVVVASTIAAFPSKPELVAFRFLAGLIIALAVGALLVAWTPPERNAESRKRTSPEEAHPGPVTESGAPESGATMKARADRVIQKGLAGFLMLGRFFLVAAAVTALLQSIELPPALGQLRAALIPSALVATGLAYLLAAPAAGDAFVARGLLTVLPLPALTGFLVLGPMLNLRNTPVFAQILKTGHVVLLHIAVFALSLAAALAAALLMQWTP
ncbi:MAG: hypothetical protein EA427_05025 [Spirochaetaceae bacterium]|nr:MAG: hypothetical protein EA427_05025 [Spirochaetaceae bacterium]